ncbi:hypothetical protein ACHAWF_003077 [Thalassiosira exigua]
MRERRRGGDGGGGEDEDNDRDPSDETGRSMRSCSSGRQRRAEGQALQAEGLLPQLLQPQRAERGAARPPAVAADSNRNEVDAENEKGAAKEEKKFNRLFGDASVNVLGRTDPVINIRAERAEFMLAHRFALKSLTLETVLRWASAVLFREDGGGGFAAVLCVSTLFGAIYTALRLPRGRPLAISDDTARAMAISNSAVLPLPGGAETTTLSSLSASTWTNSDWTWLNSANFPRQSSRTGPEKARSTGTFRRA